MLERKGAIAFADLAPGIVARAKIGDEEAFHLIFNRYGRPILSFINNLVQDRDLAEDLTQETFLKAFGHLQSFQAGTNFRAWLFRIAHNSFLNQQRNGGGRRQPFPEQVADEDEGPEQSAQTRESLQLLARAVAKLPMEFRAAFLLRVEEGLSFRQIADALGLTEETARWRVFKARQKLMDVLAPQLEQEQS